MKLLQLLEFQNQNSKQAEILISSSPDKKKKKKKIKAPNNPRKGKEI